VNAINARSAARLLLKIKTVKKLFARIVNKQMNGMRSIMNAIKIDNEIFEDTVCSGKSWDCSCIFCAGLPKVETSSKPATDPVKLAEKVMKKFSCL
jgi:hypothetical protein